MENSFRSFGNVFDTVSFDIDFLDIFSRNLLPKVRNFAIFRISTLCAFFEYLYHY